MFSKSAKLYDTIYLNMGKDYAAEAGKIRAFIRQYKQTAGDLLLDVACGTGLHIDSLRRFYQVEGLDLDQNMLEMARQKFPEIPFHHADMLDFDLGRQFDVITCLFSSIGYVRSVARMNQAIANMARHLKPGGVLLVEPWFSPENWNTGTVHATFVDKPDLKIARMNFSQKKGRLSFFKFYYLVGTPEGIERFEELHELGLFTEAEYLNAFRKAGVDVIHDPQGLDGRGLYIGRNQIYRARNMNQFRSRILHSITDENLQIALDNNARRRTAGRLTAFASLPDFPQRRLQAHAIKTDVVAHLDEYLVQFIANVEKNGIQVHRAADAAEAIRIFMEISRSLEAKHASPMLVAKSKSMLSEEIDFNHILEASGMRVVETDLGEYIVQLRGERPSHIITPAVHLRRADVGKLFEEKLGIPYTEDIPTLTNTARKVLRAVFLDADIGISGVNFGVAGTGTLAIVTNEGNGRMCTTLPPVHVALMGIERLVPTLDDLALFLSLLPRSATGQKLSVYTSLINAPLPGQKRHLILLDNGRSALRNSPLAESLFCIRCGACLNACPVFREIGGHAYGSIYSGPIGSVISCALVDPKYASLAQASSLCGACREACPVDIDLPGMLLRVRSGVSPVSPGGNTTGAAGVPAPVKLGLMGFRLAAGNAILFGIFQRLGGLFSWIYSPRREYMHIPAWTGWGHSKDFPRLAVRPFRDRWGKLTQTVEEKMVGNSESREFSEPLTQPPPKTLSAQFADELTDLGGQVHLVSEKGLSVKLAEFLRSKGFARVLVDDAGAQYVPPLSEGIDIVREPDPSIRAGVTGALAGISDTGSLLLVSGAGQTLTASLLPEVHVVVLKTSMLFPSLTDALRLPEVREAQAGVVVTGPSRTADIEMTLTIGVHGPGELHVFLIDDSMPV